MAESEAAAAYKPGPGILSENIPKFWNEWSPVARAYLRKAGGDDGTEVLRLLVEAEATQDVIPLGTMVADRARQAGKVWQELSLMCRGEAGRVVQSVEIENGFEAWRLLSRRARGGGQTRAKTLLSVVLSFKFDTKTILDDLNRWEKLISQYEAGPPVREFGDDLRVSTVIANTRGALAQKFAEQLLTLDRYDQVKRYAEQYCDMKTVYDQKTGLVQDKTNDDAMEVSYLGKNGKKGGNDNGKGKSKWKGNDSKGKKGKSKDGKKGKKGKNKEAHDKVKTAYFEGNCKGCGVYGHKWTECWYNKDNGHAGKPAAASLTEVAVTEVIVKGLTLEDSWDDDWPEEDWPEYSEWQEGYEENEHMDPQVMCGLMAGCVAACATSEGGYEYALLDSGSAITACEYSFGEQYG
jgi:hypothetical protein